MQPWLVYCTPEIAQGPITESPNAAVLDVPLDDRLGPEE